jgi:transposase-like protein
VRRMEMVPVAKAAQACGVSVSVLHRWRKQLGGVLAAEHRDAKPGSRRVFAKEFKDSVVKRLESGESVSDVVRALQLNPTVVRRWRQEWRKYGEAAFSGYGKTRSPADSTRTVVVRFTEEEYDGIKAASLARHASSLPDFVRAQLLPASSPPTVGEIADRLTALVAAVHDATNDSLAPAAQEKEPLGPT